MTLASKVGDKVTAVLQAKVDSKRRIWLCSRDGYNSGNPVYVQGVPLDAKAGDVVTGVVADTMGTVFFSSREVRINKETLAFE